MLTRHHVSVALAITLSLVGCAAVHSLPTPVTEYYGHFTKQEISEITQFIRTKDSHAILSMTHHSDGTVEVLVGERDGLMEEGSVYYLKRHGRSWKVVRESAFVT